MTNVITAGSLLIEEGTPHLPNSLLRQSESYSKGWAAVNATHSVFEKEIDAAGWTFFFMAGEIKATVFGFDKEKTLHTAVERLLANAHSQKCNSIEITQVAGNSFLNVPYVSVTAHARHLQKGLNFCGQH